MNFLTAIDFTDSLEAKNDLRILNLLPNLLKPLAVEPGIPEDFVALSPTGILDPCDWIYWGPKDVLEAYFKNPSSLEAPILRVKLSANVVQTGPNSFSDEAFLDSLKKEDPNACFETKWGDYPVCAIKARIEGNLIFMAWVGLNDPEAGWTLLFNLVCSDEKGHPNKQDRKLWENLLIKTTSLKDGDYFKALGQDLQEGYTIANFNGAKLKMFAEKRQRDGVLQVVVFPEPDVEFYYEDMEEVLMGAEWKYGEPMVKVYGEVVFKNASMINDTKCVTSIFFKTVPEFSFKKEDPSELLIFQKMCETD